uniref:CCHC-type domain-containing protein n=1 Tax=Eptatretus burgeri TaxID=7764 RepID=A0A8C4WXL2_EPTBU
MYPPFITNDKLMCILSRYGTVVSKISIPLRARDERIKHVMSFRRQVYMVLPDRGDDTSLNISFQVTLNKYEYQMYATSASLTCFNCGVFGHVKRFCPKVSCVKCGEAGHNDTDLTPNTQTLPVVSSHKKTQGFTPFPNPKEVNISALGDIEIPADNPNGLAVAACSVEMEEDPVAVTKKQRASDISIMVGQHKSTD